jgi:polar amino acid transport system substrate-binding protein
MLQRIGIITLTFLMVFLPVVMHADTITIKADEWCPFNCEPGSDSPGYMVEVARIIFQKAGHELIYENMPWSRSIDHARKGKIDAIPGATKGEVPDFIFSDEEFGASITYFFVKKGTTWRFTDVGSLESIRIGVQDDYEYGGKIDEYIEKNRETIHVQVVKSDDPVALNIKKLIKGNIDACPEDKLVFLYKAKSMGVLDQVEEAGIIPVDDREDFEATRIYLAFSPVNPKSAEYAKILSDGIREMRASGELQKILDKYGLKDWKKELDALRKDLGL